MRPLSERDFFSWKKAQEEMLPAKSLFDAPGKPLKECNRTEFKKILRKHREGIKGNQHYSFGVFLKGKKCLIGYLGVKHILRGHYHSASIGYWIFNNYWGNGYATEATDLCVTIAFEDLKLHRVEAEIQPANKPSIKVVRKLGFWKEGLSKKRLFMRGRWRDYLVYALTCEKRGYSLNLT